MDTHHVHTDLPIAVGYKHTGTQQQQKKLGHLSSVSPWPKARSTALYGWAGPDHNGLSGRPSVRLLGRLNGFANGVAGIKSRSPVHQPPTPRSVLYHPCNCNPSRMTRARACNVCSHTGRSHILRIASRAEQEDEKTNAQSTHTHPTRKGEEANREQTHHKLAINLPPIHTAPHYRSYPKGSAHYFPFFLCASGVHRRARCTLQLADGHSA